MTSPCGIIRRHARDVVISVISAQWAQTTQGESQRGDAREETLFASGGGQCYSGRGEIVLLLEHVLTTRTTAAHVVRPRGVLTCPIERVMNSRTKLEQKQKACEAQDAWISGTQVH